MWDFFFKKEVLNVELPKNKLPGKESLKLVCKTSRVSEVVFTEEVGV